MGDLAPYILGSSIVVLALLVIMGVVYTVWSSVKMRKKRAYFEELHTELAPGQRVMFGGGVFGTIQKVSGDVVDVKVKSGAVLEVSRYAIQQVSEGN